MRTTEFDFEGSRGNVIKIEYYKYSLNELEFRKELSYVIGILQGHYFAFYEQRFEIKNEIFVRSFDGNSKTFTTGNIETIEDLGQYDPNNNYEEFFL